MHDHAPPDSPPHAPPSDGAREGSPASLLRLLAHELRNPLATLRNAVQLARAAQDPQAAAQALAIVERQSALLAHVVEDVVDLATLEAGAGELALAALDARTMLDAAVALTADARARRGQPLAVEHGAEPLPVHGDEARLVRSLARLLERASGAAPHGAQISLAAARAGTQAVLRIRHAEDGLDAASLRDLFALRESARAAARAPSSASLPLVARVVGLHGGTLAATSDAGGTEVVVALPVAAAPGGRRILVVDDDRDTADVLCSVLAGDGHVARAVYRACEVLPAALEFAPDTVLLDIGLPDHDGLAVARDLRGQARLAPLRIFAVTGYGFPLDRQRSREAGVDAHFTKPIEVDRLRELLRAP